jgi:hypothetical protein
MFYGDTPFSDLDGSVINTYSNIMSHKLQVSHFGQGSHHAPPQVTGSGGNGTFASCVVELSWICVTSDWVILTGRTITFE